MARIQTPVSVARSSSWPSDGSMSAKARLKTPPVGTDATGRNSPQWPGFTWAFRRRTRRFDARRITSGRRLLKLAKTLRFRQSLQLLECVVLDLANALARHAEGPPDLFQRERLL